jgi:hypothetical protein
MGGELTALVYQFLLSRSNVSLTLLIFIKNNRILLARSQIPTILALGVIFVKFVHVACNELLYEYTIIYGSILLLADI